MKMKGISEKDEDNIFSMRENIQAGLQNIDFDGNWYDDYLNWRKDDRNSFDSLLTINNPFNLSCVGDRVEFNLSDPKNIRDLDIFCMSVFLSEKVRITTQKVFDYVRTERIREKKVKRIEEYFELLRNIVDDPQLTVQKLSVYDELYRSVSAEFAKYAVELMKHPQIFSSLVSAEYLYRQYVLNRKPINNFDYSCISIMYYMSLEDFINKLVYIPYANEVLSKLSKNKIKDKKWKDEEAYKYVSSVGAFWDKCQRLKKSCEIGVLGYLFEAVPDEDYFKKFLTDHFGEIDTNQVERFGTKLKKIAPRRNDAAHGGNYLTYEDVCTDKDNIYNTVIDNYRGMILELMGICFDR